MSFSQLQTTFLANFRYLNAQNQRNNRFGFSLNNNKELTTFLEQQARQLKHSVAAATNEDEVINFVIEAISKAYCERTALQYRTREIVTNKLPGALESDSYYMESCVKQGEFERQLLTALTACANARGITQDVQTKFNNLKNRIERLPTQMQVVVRTIKDSTGYFVPTTYRSEQFKNYFRTGNISEAFLNTVPTQLWRPERTPVPAVLDVRSEPVNTETRPRAKCCF